MRIAVHPPATVRLLRVVPETWAVGLEGISGHFSPDFSAKSSKFRPGSDHARAHTHTHALAVSQGVQVEDMAFRNTLGSASRCGRSRWRSALGEQKIFGV